MRYAVVDRRIAAEIECSLGGYVDKILKLPAFEPLPSPVASHPDMLMWRYERTVVTYRDYFEVAREQFLALESIGYSIVLCDERPSDKYPTDISLNCVSIGRNIVANTKFASAQIHKIAKSRGLRMLHVNQGYTKCATVCVADTAIITADPSIYGCAVKNGICALKIREGHVGLDGYGTGFIGGATGKLEDAVLFCGDLSTHPDASRISEFCASHKKSAVSLGSGALYDYGTVMIF